jgi:hypothetical protein
VVGLTTTEKIVTDARFSSCSDDYNGKSYLTKGLAKQFSPFPPPIAYHCDNAMRARYSQTTVAAANAVISAVS